jgi:hypothetical protein
MTPIRLSYQSESPSANANQALAVFLWLIQ